MKVENFPSPVFPYIYQAVNHSKSLIKTSNILFYLDQDNDIYRCASDFSLNKADILLIKGDSGTGKTSLLESIVGIRPLKSGKITRYNSKSQNLLFIPQLPDATSILSLYDLIMCSAEAFCDNYLDLFISYCEKMNLNISDYFVNLISIDASQLSGGMLQKVRIALALCVKTNFLIFDEPFSAMDSSSQILAVNLIKSKSLDMCIIYTSHAKNTWSLASKTITL